MPYILVDIILGYLSIAFFSLTSAALVFRDKNGLAFLARWLICAALLAATVLIIMQVLTISIRSTSLSDPLFFVGLANSVVLAYLFMDKRYFLNMSPLWRRIMLCVCSIVVAFVPALAVVTAVVAIYTIR